MPDWQTAAGGTMSFEVASIRPTKEGDVYATEVSFEAVMMRTTRWAAVSRRIFRCGFTSSSLISFGFRRSRVKAMLGESAEVGE